MCLYTHTYTDIPHLYSFIYPAIFYNTAFPIKESLLLGIVSPLSLQVYKQLLGDGLWLGRDAREENGTFEEGRMQPECPCQH